MKKKIFLNLTLFIFIFILVSCKSNEKASQEDINKIKEISYTEVMENITKTIEEFDKKYDYLEVEDINFSEDKLVVDTNNKVKKFNNIILELKVEFDLTKASGEDIKNMSTSEKDKLFDKFTRESKMELQDNMNKNNLMEFVRIGEINSIYTDSKNKIKNNENHGMLRDKDTMKSLAIYENESEKIVLDSLFNYLDNILEDKKDIMESYDIKRFGIDKSYILLELDIYDNDKKEEDSEEISNDLNNIIKENTEYIKDIDIIKIKLSYPNQSGELIEYEYKN